MYPKRFSSSPAHRCLVSIGECMVELAPGADPDNFRLGFAGDTFNTAWYLRQLQPGWAVRYMTAVGRDAVSDAMLAKMQGAGIDTRHVLRDPERTVGLYLIALQNGERSFSYWRSQSAARRLAQDPDVLAQAMKGAALVYVSGITMAILDDFGRETLLGELVRTRAAGSLIAFDPNLRSQLWEDAQTMCRVVTQTAAVSDIVLPSFEDEAEHFGDANPEATLARYLQGNTRTVIVKNGPGAVLFRHEDTTGTFLPHPVRTVVDTTSAGDSFNAGVLAGLLSGEPADQAVQQGSRVAAQVVGQRGALVPLDCAIS
ncbi:sugar kinase [Puniceibacterium sediminis]|uniref:2-keto-3-deoxygluconate kinase n=1 Tax=Puniceibacterium sediminis TaxID=1608407 RepID=A0A238WCE3_9RHOB|nr:sugar kinase [Puniceibacterium sediminis]SNR44148.1 2-keto-3-deoxygluconate kinase [Puniceibacterium sediminis]